MKKIIFITVLVSIVLFATRVHAQAYDSENENKVFLGYSNIRGGSGIELRVDHGRGDIFSMGFNATYLFFKIEQTVDDDEFDKFSYVMENLDLGALFNFHLSPALNMEENIDPYLGIFVNLKSIGLHAGCKYNFSERWGIYAQLAKSFSKSLYSVSQSGNELHYSNYFGVSAGVTYNIMR